MRLFSMSRMAAILVSKSKTVSKLGYPLLDGTGTVVVFTFHEESPGSSRLVLAGIETVEKGRLPLKSLPQKPCQDHNEVGDFSEDGGNIVFS
jgi:hypothetical protein